MEMKDQLNRFLREGGAVYSEALEEVRRVHKMVNKMWLVFPQPRGLYDSWWNSVYSIEDLEEARAYLAHPVLGARLREICEAYLKLPAYKEGDDASQMDSVYLHACVTMFSQADEREPIFRQLLDKFFRGARHFRTLEILWVPREKIRFFHQRTNETCGPACMLMLLDYYRRKVKYPTRKMEQKLYDSYGSKDLDCRGTTGGGIANCLSKNGLEVQLLHSSKNLMENRDGYFEEDLFGQLLERYRYHVDACRDRIHLETGTQITCDRLKRFLAEDKQIILQCIVPGNADGIHQEVLHWVLLFDYVDGHFVGCDPDVEHPQDRMRRTDEEVEHYMDTPIGKICVVVGAPKK